MATTEFQAPRPYDVSIHDGVMRITIRKEFDQGHMHQDWAHAIVVQHPGPFRSVQVDCSHSGLLSSTFFAGLIQLFHTFGAQCGPIVVERPDPRVERSCVVLHLEGMVRIVSR
jgi:hypothetical protein